MGRLSVRTELPRVPMSSRKARISACVLAPVSTTERIGWSRLLRIENLYSGEFRLIVCIPSKEEVFMPGWLSATSSSVSGSSIEVRPLPCESPFTFSVVAPAALRPAEAVAGATFAAFSSALAGAKARTVRRAVSDKDIEIFINQLSGEANRQRHANTSTCK